jgi:hypothetical protein
MLQRFFGLVVSALLLHEQIQVSSLMIVVTIGIVARVAGAKKLTN